MIRKIQSFSLLVMLCLSPSVFSQSAGDMYVPLEEGETLPARESLVAAVEQFMDLITHGSRISKSSRAILTSGDITSLRKKFNHFVQTALNESQIILREAVQLEQNFNYWLAVINDWRYGRGILVFVGWKYTYWIKAWTWPYLGYELRTPFWFSRRLSHATDLLFSAVETNQFDEAWVKKLPRGGGFLRAQEAAQKLSATVNRASETGGRRWGPPAPREFNFLARTMTQLIMDRYATGEAAAKAGAVLLMDFADCTVEEVYETHNAMVQLRDVVDERGEEAIRGKSEDFGIASMADLLKRRPDIAADLRAPFGITAPSTPDAFIEFLRTEAPGGEGVEYGIREYDEGVVIFRGLLTEPEWNGPTIDVYVRRFIETCVRRPFL